MSSEGWVPVSVGKRLKVLTLSKFGGLQSHLESATSRTCSPLGVGGCVDREGGHVPVLLPLKLTSERILSCETLRGIPSLGLQKALGRSTGAPPHLLKASVWLQMGSSIPDTDQTSGFHPVRAWKDTSQVETVRSARTLSSSLPHSPLECSGKLRRWAQGLQKL